MTEAKGAGNEAKNVVKDINKKIFEANPKHGAINRGNANKAPTNPQYSLDNSYQVSANTTRRVGYDSKANVFNVFDEHAQGKFHGHSRYIEYDDYWVKKNCINALGDIVRI